MIVISHRGYWEDRQERNTRAAFLRSFSLGFGTETDVRDSNGTLVISHDPPTGGEMSLIEFLALPGIAGLPLAINVKADGLAEPLMTTMQAAGHENWFAFDMSVPDMLQYLRVGCPTFTRLSEYEPQASCIDRATGIWLDAFEGEWFDAALIQEMLSHGRQVCVVSSELHGRDPAQLWALLEPLRDAARLMLCTDMPEQARDQLGASL
jgi:hypothetical protein